MGLHVFDSSEQGADFIVCVISLPICILATILRFASTMSSRRKFGCEDMFALLALVFYLLYTLMSFWSESTRYHVATSASGANAKILWPLSHHKNERQKRI